MRLVGRLLLLCDELILVRIIGVRLEHYLIGGQIYFYRLRVKLHYMMSWLHYMLLLLRLTWLMLILDGVMRLLVYYMMLLLLLLLLLLLRLIYLNVIRVYHAHISDQLLFLHFFECNQVLNRLWLCV